MQLMLLEQQNKKSLLKARQELILELNTPEVFTDLATGVTDVEASATSVLGPSIDEMNVVNDESIKAKLQEVLGGASPSQSDLQKLKEYIDLLQVQAHQFEKGLNTEVPFRWQTIYRIKRRVTVHNRLIESYSPFFDHPEWVQGQEAARHIKSSVPLSNLDLYLERNKDIAFIVYRNFDTEFADVMAKPETEYATHKRIAHLPQHASETIRPVNKDLIEAIKMLMGTQQEYTELLREFSSSLELPAPYLFLYHSRKNLEYFQNGLPMHGKTQLPLLLKYVTEQYGDEYAAADSLLSQNKISPEYIRYLFKPGDVLVECIKGQYVGYVSTSWPEISKEKQTRRAGSKGSQFF